MASALLSTSLKAIPLAALRGRFVVIDRLPLFLLGSPVGAGIALPSESCLLSVFLRLGVASSKSPSSRGILEMLDEWPWPCEAT
jgi:hypothetical protein